MKVLIIIAYIFVFGHDAAVIMAPDEEVVVHDRPIIGVLAQEQAFHLQLKYPNENYTSYISASYVKDVEKSGARVVPIMIGKNRSYYENLMKKLNGVLLPGGATFFNQSNGYADAGQHIYEIAVQMNEAGDYFPIYGTCLGFELLIVLAGGRQNDDRVKCFCFNNENLRFTQDYQTSKFFKNAPNEVKDILALENVTINAHSYCITDESLKSHNLTGDWRVSSHSGDSFGKEFIASIEHTRYPFYGTQFHPEKTSFEWSPSKYYAHTSNAVKANRYFMDFFISECKKSRHSFKDTAEENHYLIYNNAPTFTGAVGSAYTQCYFFEPRGNVTS